MITIGSLFSGIGGFEHGFNLASKDKFKVIWQVENDPFCNSILEKHYPNTKRYSDIKEVDVDGLERPNIICASPPCQPFSTAGKRKGSEDDRHLWPETFRIIRNLRPDWFVLENVRGLFTSEKGKIFGRILSDLDSIRYDAEWQVLPAKAFGAPHKRDRVFVVANPVSKRLQRPFFEEGICCLAEQTLTKFGNRDITCGSWWTENIPNIRVGNGVPLRVARHRVKAYGNSICPQVIEFLAKRILDLEGIL
jgi:DNA (cytosine-5)-methyltransferase 1